MAGMIPYRRELDRSRLVVVGSTRKIYHLPELGGYTRCGTRRRVWAGRLGDLIDGALPGSMPRPCRRCFPGGAPSRPVVDG